MDQPRSHRGRIMKKCWETMGCKVWKDCPAYPDHGRACFAVPGTLCRGEKQGDYETKIERCRRCKFYGEVMGVTTEKGIA